MNQHTHQEWYNEYMAMNGDLLELDGPLIQDLSADVIDHDSIKSQTQLAASFIKVNSEGYCDNCQHLFDNWPDLEPESWTHAVGRPYRTHEVIAAAQNGCKCCAFLTLKLNEVDLLETFQKIEKRLSILDPSATASLSVSNWGLGRSGQYTQLLWLNFPGKVAADCNSHCAACTIFESHILEPWAARYEIQTDPFDIASRWLSSCCDQHKACENTSELKWPTRLIDVTNNDDIKLILTAGLQSLPQYATLSYCWGREEFIKLTVHNIDSLLDGISYQNLPKTFQDAISIARSVGLAYLWIDALCIIQEQDDNGDWLRELSTMRSIYGGAHLNIAASSATNVHGGCFSKAANFSGGFIARVTTNEFCRLQNFHSHRVYEKSTSDTHLATRAWTFQEKLLAPRTVYMGDRGMFWECRTTIASEFLPDGFPDKLGSQLVRPEDTAWNWRDIVSNYSKANLTNGADKLPALSGIARRQYESMKDQYLAGLWRKRLTKQLGWVRSGDEEKDRPSWRAPTWSWASIDGEIHLWGYWDHTDLAKNEYVQVLEARTTPIGSDPFGAVTDGEILLRCTAMVRGECSTIADSYDDYVILDSGKEHFPIIWDCSDSIDEQSSVYLLPLFGGDSGMGRVFLKGGSTGNEKVEDDDKGEYTVPELMIRGMVLQQTGFAKGQFHRVGSFEYLHEPAPPDEIKPEGDHYYEFLRNMEEVGASTAESICVEVVTETEHPESRYVIVIV